MTAIRRRVMMANNRPRYLGTSDFSLQNVTVYQNSSKLQYLDIYLFKEEIPFTILMDCQVVDGYDSNGRINLDFLSGGAISRGNFSKGLGIRHYSTYSVNYLFNKGPYNPNAANDYDPHKFIVRYNPNEEKNVKSYIDSRSYESTATFVQSDNPLYMGGNNNSYSTLPGYGTINELMIYYRALGDTDILGYINNGIIP